MESSSLSLGLHLLMLACHHISMSACHIPVDVKDDNNRSITELLFLIAFKDWYNQQTY